MKIERTRDLQTDRIDRQKLNNVLLVAEGVRPGGAKQGQLLYDGTGVFIRVDGVWKITGLSMESVAAVADQQIAAAPRATRIENIPISQVVAGAEQTEYRSYVQGNPPGAIFVAKFYGSLSDRDDGTELPTAEQPTGVTFEPTEPVQEEGTQTVKITYTPVSRTGLTFLEIYVE